MGVGRMPKNQDSERMGAGLAEPAGMDPEEDRGVRDAVGTVDSDYDRFRELADFLPACVFETDAAGRAVYVNEQFGMLIGCGRDKILARDSIVGFVAPGFHDIAQRAFNRMMAGGDAITIELEVQRSDGTRFPVVCHVAPVERGDVVCGVRGVILDISSRRYTEDRMQMLSRAVIQSPDGIALLDQQGGVQYSNPAWARMHGRSVRLTLGMTAAEFITPEHFENTYLPAMALIMAEGAWEGESRHVRADGTEFPVSVIASIMRDRNGDPLGVVVQIRDITLRREEERIRRDTELQTARLFANMPGMAYRCRRDGDWNMEFVSEGCEALTGYRPDELVGDGGIAFAELIHPEDRARVRGIIDRAVAAGERFRIEYRLFSAAGDERWVWEQGLGVCGDDGEVMDVEGFITDVTERVRADRQRVQGEELLRSLMRAVGEGVALLEIVDDDAGRPIDAVHRQWNRTYCELTGLVDDELKDLKLSDITPQKYAQDLENFTAVIVGGETLELEWDALSGDRKMEVTVLPAGGRRIVLVVRGRERGI